jgi:hypothetical protein
MTLMVVESESSTSTLDPNIPYKREYIIDTKCGCNQIIQFDSKLCYSALNEKRADVDATGVYEKLLY